MSLAIAANIVLATVVLSAVVGLLSWAIRSSRPQQLPASMTLIRIRRPYARDHRAGRRSAAIQPQS